MDENIFEEALINLTCITPVKIDNASHTHTKDTKQPKDNENKQTKSKTNKKQNKKKQTKQNK